MGKGCTRLVTVFHRGTRSVKLCCVYGERLPCGVSHKVGKFSTEEQDEVSCVVCMGKGCTRLVTVFHRGTRSSKLCCVYGEWLYKIVYSRYSLPQRKVSCVHGGRLHLDSLTRFLHSLLVAQRNKIR